jgi:hypothetical protein
MEMSETPAKPESEEAEHRERLVFTPMQARAVLEAAKVQEISQKYIDTLNNKILDLANKSADLRSQISVIDTEIAAAKKEADSTETAAKASYIDTLNLTLSELDTPEPPWNATVILEEGLPVGIDLLKTVSKT